MKNLQISDNDLMGNRFNGHDLHFYLRDRGIEANQLVWKKKSNDPFTFELARNIPNRDRLNNHMSVLQWDLATQSSLYPFSYTLFFDELFLETDIVHYHLIHNNFFNINHLPLLTKLKPTVWTLHDPWAVTGRCIYFFDCSRWQNGCGDCPNLQNEFNLRKDLTALNWEMKKQAYKNSNLDIVVVSKWMYDIVKSSPLTNHFDVHLIPFGLNLENFYSINKSEARKHFGIARNNKVLAFRASPRELKGIRYIKEALNKIGNSDDITLITVDTKGLMDEFKNRFQVIDLGWTDDADILRKFYSVADLFLMPSEEEAFGLSAVEAMACGTPVVGFDRTALPDTIGAPNCGVIVPKGSSEALQLQIELLLNDEDRRQNLSINALKMVREKHDLNRYINNMVDLYKEVLEKRDIDKQALYILGQLNSAKFGVEENFDYSREDGLNKEEQLLLMKVKNKVKKYPLLTKIVRPIYDALRRILLKL